MQTIDCHTAINKLLAYLEKPDPDPVEIDAVVRHIQDCPDCQRRAGHLVRALATEEEDRLTCRECQDALPDYFEAETAGWAGQPRWRPVSLHLETCPHCSAAYAALSELSELAFGEKGEEPPHYPVPDLSFLRPKKMKPVEPAQTPWRLDELGRLIIEFSAELVRALQPPTYRPAYATARTKSDRSRRTLGQFILKGEIEDLDVTITAEEEKNDPSRCTVVVEINIPSRGGWPNLADMEVTLKQNEEEVETQLTDAYGKAIFEGIAAADLPNLVFEIDSGS